MTVGGGVEMLRCQYLAGFKGSSTYPTVPCTFQKTDAALDATLDDVAKLHPELSLCLYNDVKVCPDCSKPCAFTMTTCNNCGRDLRDVAMSKSENVFSAFLFGVKRAGKGFPYTISLRRETDHVLIFDDMLALTPCHLNGIPKTHYIPDWRFLLTSPKQALELLDRLEAELWEATQPFLQNREFRTAIYRGSVSDEDIRKKIIVSFNFPPSQFQLHVQWVCPPLTPFQQYMTETRNHFSKGRAFPLSYVRNLLKLDERYEVTKDTDIGDIISHYAKLGVDYEAEWTSWFDELVLPSTLTFQNWSPAEFDYVVQDKVAHSFEVVDGKVKLGSPHADVDCAKVQAADKTAMQNYGRPYTAEGKPIGTYAAKPLALKCGAGGYGEWPGVDWKAS